MSRRPQKELTPENLLADFGQGSAMQGRLCPALSGDIQAYYALIISELAAHIAPEVGPRLMADLPMAELMGAGELPRVSGLFDDLGYARTTPGQTGDPLKRLFMDLMPRPGRHARGEFYTPDWLADHVLNLLGYDGDPRLRVLDPACGSGTFITRLLNRARGNPRSRVLPPQTLLRLLTQNIVGFDLNPLAVLTARTNVLLTLGDLLQYAPPEFELPIHLTDALEVAPRRTHAPFDLVAGNPPWLNWANLKEEDRRRTEPLWKRHKLFPHKGYRARLGGAMDDLSILLLYTAMDRHLAPSGTLGFVITQSVFHSEGGGRGFRRFQLGDGEPLQVKRVEDLSALQPFEGASTRTAVVVMKRGHATSYPVPYGRWIKKKRGRHLSADMPLHAVLENITIQPWEARPIHGGDLTSPWIVGEPAALAGTTRCMGESAYVGRSRYGVHTHCNGVYWVDVAEKDAGARRLVQNLGHLGRPPVEVTPSRVEQASLFPLLRGRDVQRWSATPAHHIVLAQDPERPARALSQDQMARQLPGTYAYFKQHEARLRRRSGFSRFFNPEVDPFYSVYNMGPYTLSPFKVVWREQAALLTCAVIGSHQGRLIIPDHKLTLCPFEDETEAHYLCAFLSSTPARFLVQSYAISTSVATHLLKYLKIPAYDPRLEDHATLATASLQGHRAALAGDEATMARLGAVIDEAVAGIWRLSGVGKIPMVDAMNIR